MSEKINTAIDVIVQAANHKATNFTVAAGLVVAGQSSQPTYKSLSEIPLSEIFSHEPSSATFATMLGSLWIIYQLTKELIKGIAWLIKKYGEK